MEEEAPTISMSSDDANMAPEATKNSPCEDAPRSSNRGAEDDLSGGTAHIDEEEIDEGENGDSLAEEPVSEPDEALPLNSSIHTDQLDIFSLVARQQKLRAAQQEQSQLLVLASLYGQAGNRESFSQQSHTFTILKGAFGNKVPPFTIIDASDPENYPQRDALLDISGIGPVYPQFFLVKTASKKKTETPGEEDFNSGGEGEEDDFTVDLNDSCMSLSGFMVHGLDEYNDIQFFGDYQDLFVANERRTLRSSFLMHKPLIGLGKEISSGVDEDGGENEPVQECEDEDGADSNEDLALAAGTEEANQEYFETENVGNDDEFIDATKDTAENDACITTEKHTAETAEDAEEIQISSDPKMLPDEVEEDIDIGVDETAGNLNNIAAPPDEVEEAIMEENIDTDVDEVEEENMVEDVDTDADEAAGNSNNIQEETEEVSNDIEPPTAKENEAGDSPDIDSEETPEISGLGFSSETETLDTSVAKAEEENTLGKQIVDDNGEPSSLSNTDSSPAVEPEEDAIAATEDSPPSADSEQQSGSQGTIPNEAPPSEEPQIPSSQGVTEKEAGEESKSAAKKKTPVLGKSRMKKDFVHLAGNLEVPEWVDLYFILPTNPVVNWTENQKQRITDDRKVETTMEITLILKNGEQVKQSHSTLEFKKFE